MSEEERKYHFNQFYIPERMRGGLTRYIENHIKPGGFLCAVISNNLKEAVGRADEENMANLPAYMNYLYNHAPYNCWGSPEEMKTWLEERVERCEHGTEVEHEHCEQCAMEAAEASWEEVRHGDRDGPKGT
jgi:hypothetical protein